MDFQGTISAVGDTLCGWHFSRSATTAEEFAQKRFLGKIEYPDSNLSKGRREDAWRTWLESDKDLPDPTSSLLGPNWARAKLLIAEILKGFHLGPISFTNGSEFIPTEGFNSIESKLSKSVWTCTYDNFDLWADSVYHHHGLKQAMRKRFARLLATNNWDGREINKKLWLRYRNMPDYQRLIFNFKLSLVTEMVQGNRFSTVPKSNLKDRPICIEPLANILTQRRIGIGVRQSLRDFGVDLDMTAEKHRRLISNPKVATIDLKNASDRISLKVVKYLLPPWLFKYIEQSRSAMTLGLDDNYYLIEKVSSMGNGFTFELMSLILYAISRSFSTEASVFGDDIIVPNDVADLLLDDLQRGGFNPNYEKTHIRDSYRESCGAHYLDGHGYVESYDFRYPENIADVITTCNKLSRLANIYPSFRSLFVEVYRATPATLYAENPCKVTGAWRRKQEPFDSPKLDTHTVMSPFQFRKDGIPWTRSAWKRFRRYCQHLQLNPRGASLHYGFEWKDAQSAPSDVIAGTHWAKILMYLASGRTCCDTVKGKGVFKSFAVVTLSTGQSFRWSSIVATITRK